MTEESANAHNSQNSADSLLKKSAERKKVDDAESKLVQDRNNRIFTAWNNVRKFVDVDVENDFWTEWSALIVELGAVLKDEGLDKHLESLQPTTDSQMHRDGFVYAVEIFKQAVEGNQIVVKKLLKQSLGNEEPEFGFRDAVSEAIRRDLMPMIIEMDREGGMKRASDLPFEDEITEEPQTVEALPPSKPRRKHTTKGEAEAKLIAALLHWHKYNVDGIDLRLEHIGCRQLAKAAGTTENDVSMGAASEFFKRKFESHSTYKGKCRDSTNLLIALMVLNGDIAPRQLLGDRDKLIPDNG